MGYGPILAVVGCMAYLSDGRRNEKKMALAEFWAIMTKFGAWLGHDLAV